MEKTKSFVQIVSEFFDNNWLHLTILIGLVVGVYFNALNNGLVSDDTGFIKEGSNLATTKFVLSDPSQILRFLLYSLMYQGFGVNNFVFHLSNVIFHLGNTVLVFMIVMLLNRRIIAFFTAALFAVHPAISEVVVWISGGGYAQYTFFFLLTLYFYIIYRRAQGPDNAKAGFNSKKYYFLSLGAFFLDLFSSNRVITLVPILLVYEFSFAKQTGGIRKNWKSLLPFFVLTFIIGVIYILKIGTRAGEVGQTGNVTSWVYNPLFQIPFALTNYFQLFIWPDMLTFYHSNIQTTPAEMFLRWLGLLAFTSALVWSYLKDRYIFFWLGFFLVSMAMTLLPLQIAWIVAERYVYMGSIGIFAAVALVAARLTRYKKNPLLTYSLLTLLILPLSLRTIVRNFDWKDDDTLMIATLRTNPENAKVHDGVGMYYFKNKDFTQAIAEFEKAIKLDDGLVEPLIHLADTYHALGQGDKAEPYYKRARELAPKN